MSCRARLNLTAWCAQLRSSITKSLLMLFGIAKSEILRLKNCSLLLERCTIALLRIQQQKKIMYSMLHILLFGLLSDF